MNIRIHMPDSEAGLQLLTEKVAVLHKEAIVAYLDRMMLTKNEKTKIFNFIKESIHYENTY